MTSFLSTWRQGWVAFKRAVMAQHETHQLAEKRMATAEVTGQEVEDSSLKAAVEGTGSPTFLTGRDSKTLLCLCHPSCQSHVLSRQLCCGFFSVPSRALSPVPPSSQYPGVGITGFVLQMVRQAYRGRLECQEGLIGRCELCNESLLDCQGLVPTNRPLLHSPARPISYPGTAKLKPLKLLFRTQNNTAKA